MKTVLIIEDDTPIREALSQALELEGYSVYSASNGKEGLEILRLLPAPCLILLDLMMPIMNGWEFADAVQQDNILMTIPIVVVTAYAETAKSVKSKEVIKKPVNLDRLMDCVKRYCG